MTPQKRRALERTAFEHHRDDYLARMAVTGLGAVALGWAFQPAGLAVATFGFLPAWAAYVRRELAVGALLAEDARLARLAGSVPSTDLRVAG